MRSKRIWGMSGHGHDASITVWYENDLMEELYTSKPYHTYEDVSSLKKKFGTPDLVVWYESPFWKSTRQWYAGQANPWQRNKVRKILDSIGLDKTAWTNVLHHEAHAAWAHESNFGKCLIFVMDSIGEWDCTSVWIKEGPDIAKKASIRYPDSLGLFYSAMTQEAGLVPNKDESKLMNMSQAANPHLKQKIKNELLLSASWQPRFSKNLHRGLGGKYSNIDPQDIASCTQEIFEDLVINMIDHWVKKEQTNNIVLSGGCAHNSKLVKKLKKLPYNVWIPPRPGDDGSAYSAVLSYNINHFLASNID